MIVSDVMTPRDDLVTVSIPGTRDDALEYLQERSFSSVPVVKETAEGERYRGLVSREDLINNPDEDQLAILMDEVPTTAPDASITDLAHLIAETGARRVPVVSEESLRGIVTITDVIRAIADGAVDGDTPVDELARRDINTTYERAPLQVVERELAFARVPYAVALDDDGEMAGVVTEVDIIAVAEVVEGEEGTGDSIANQDDEWMWEGIKAVGNRYLPTRNVEIPDEPVSEYMTADVVTVTGQRTAKDASQMMLNNDIEQIPLVNGDELTGIVRDIDLVSGL
ncbi:CBS domain-containing protein [Halanaeroarchaeum sulfurireducens]|uniref:CBS domain containing protein n=1 Tax=Halanaeroarchaeum sulfurireducens TaxID=1604004 RepID=A0A0F7P5V1_9EURY|nr:CBS domain-containing protein [Halanaeroarchaeum sulfurireducens]AKH96561.1 CBS domain containing protein [Halanaeroarchaeum sulfurireducens]ALG80963.1 CBS domain containing protein [Halanaeroarchaeum sulfurireducens]